MNSPIYRPPLTLDEYFALGEDLKRETEVVDGNLAPREERKRPHQKTGFRLAGAFEAEIRKYRLAHADGEPPCYEVDTEVGLLLCLLKINLG